MAAVRPLSDEQLMLYLDGELPPEEAREVERAMAETPDARAKAEALTQMREILQARVEVAQDEVEARLGAMWDKLRPTPSRAPPRRLWTTVREWFESYRSHVLTGAVAAAAGALIATVVGGGTSAPPPRATAAEVESVEVPDGSAMVFQIPGEGAGEAPTTVIWVSEDSKQQGEGPI